MVVAGDLVIPELLGLDADPHDVVGGGERNGIGHTGKTRGNVNSELHAYNDGPVTGPTESVA